MRSFMYRCLTGICFLIAAVAQAQTARISGQVTDRQDSVISSADVHVLNLDSAVQLDTKTDGNGAYTVPYLAAGRYRIEVASPGFSRVLSGDVNLAINQALIFNVKLDVGPAQDTVTVEGGSSELNHVNLQNAEVSGTITGKEVAGLQLNGRNFTQLIALVPGVSNQTQQDEAKVGVLGSVAYSVNGGRTEYNSFSVDGSETLNTGINKDHSTLIVFPSVDAIQEIRVLTSNYGAEYPSTGNATTIVTTKSGTDQLHGNLYEFIRNEALNAKGYFDVGDRAPLYRRNDFGGTVGGPIVIPKLYGGRGKTHFFFSEEARIEKSPTAYRVPVPSLAERNGDFSDVCPGIDCPYVQGMEGLHVPVATAATTLLNSGIIPFPNAYTGCNSTIAACYNVDVSLPTYFREELFRIDHALSSKTQLALRYIHDEWDATTPIPQFSYVTNSFPTIQNRFYGPGLSWVARATTAFSASLLNESVVSYTNSHITLADVPNLGVQLSRSAPANAAIDAPVCPQVYGFDTQFQNSGCGFGHIFNNGYGDKLPGIAIGGNNAAYGGAGFTIDPSYEPWHHTNPVYSFSDNVTKLLGRHSLQFGGQWLIWQRNQTNGPIGAATADVQGLATFSNEQSAYTTGNAFADFVTMGAISSFQQDSGQANYYQRYQIVEPYLQDDWKVTPRLTINAGLRVSLFGTYHEKNKNGYNWESSAFSRAVSESVVVDPGQQTVAPDGTMGLVLASTGQLLDASTGAAVPIYQQSGMPDSRLTNGIVQCGKNGRPGSCMKGHLWNPAPRVGFAWDIRGDGKTSIRGGYGVFFEHGTADEANSGSLEGSAPLVLSMLQRNIPSLNCIGNTAVGCSPLGAGAFPLNVTAIPTKAIWPYVQQWSLSIEHELPRSFLVSVAYVGSKGTHLTTEREINQLQPTLPLLNPFSIHEPLVSMDCGQSGSRYQGEYTLQNGAVIPNTSPAFSNMQVACNGVPGIVSRDPNSFRQYAPGLGEIFSLENIADSRYSAFQATARHVSNVLTVGVAYTYSHSIDDSSDRSDATFVNSFNLKSNTASSNYDQRHLLHISYIYNLPFADGIRHLLEMKTGKSASIFGTTGISKQIIDGWQIAGITLFETGIPFTVINQGSTLVNGQATNGQRNRLSISVQDNAGVANGVGSSSYPDLVGAIHGHHPTSTGSSFGPLLLNPGAFAAPRGLTFGNAGRNDLNNPSRWNWDMSLLRNFAFSDSKSLQFRAEAFNVFNNTQFRLYDPTLGNQPQNTVSCYGPQTASYSSSWGGDAANPNGCLTGNSFLHPVDAHRPRTLQFGLKFAF